MQASWRQDADKLTFIICTLPPVEDLSSSSPSSTQVNNAGGRIIPGQLDGPANMVGDVNLFLYEDEEEDEDQKTKNDNNTKRQKVNTRQEPTPHPLIGELEIMIARTDARGKGLAKETLRAFISYITTALPAILAEYDAAAPQRQKKSTLKYLRVKIDKDNVPSIKLFEGLDFVRTAAEPNFFGEVELRSPLVGMGNEDGKEGWAKRLAYGSEGDREAKQGEGSL